MRLPWKTKTIGCKLLKGLRRMPLKFCLVLTIFMAVVQEWYPFSHFPMYSSFEPLAFYIYVADKEDVPYAMQRDFGTRTARLKKIYEGELKRLARNHPRGSKSLTREERLPAGDLAMDFLLKNASDQGQKLFESRGLRLYQVDIRYENDKITKTPMLVGERIP